MSTDLRIGIFDDSDPQKAQQGDFFGGRETVADAMRRMAATNPDIREALAKMN